MAISRAVSSSMSSTRAGIVSWAAIVDARQRRSPAISWKRLSPSNLRWFSNAAEAQAAGYRPSTARGCAPQLDTALVRVSPEAYNSIMETYKNPIVGLGEAGLVAAVIFHALNGLRIVAVDFWAKGPRYQRQMFWAVAIGFVVLFAPFVIRHLNFVFSH